MQAWWSRLSVVLVGIGTFTPAPPERKQPRRGGAGRAASRGSGGRRLRALLRRAGSLARVGGGVDKTEAIRVAVLGGWVNILITDLDVATALVSA